MKSILLLAYFAIVSIALFLFNSKELKAQNEEINCAE